MTRSLAQSDGPLAQCDARENAWPNVTGTLGAGVEGRSPGSWSPPMPRATGRGREHMSAPIPRRRRLVAAGRKEVGDGRNASGGAVPDRSGGLSRMPVTEGASTRSPHHGSQRTRAARSEPDPSRPYVGEAWRETKGDRAGPRVEGAGCLRVRPRVVMGA